MEPGVYDLLFSLNLGCLSYMFGAKLCKLTQTTRKQKSNTIPQNIYLKSLIKIGSMISRTYMLHVSHTTKGQQKRTTIQLGQPLSQGHSCSWHPERMTCSCTQHPSLRKMGAYYGVHHESYYMQKLAYTIRSITFTDQSVARWFASPPSAAQPALPTAPILTKAGVSSKRHLIGQSVNNK